MTVLVGRTRERAALHDLLVRHSARLVTLTGPGGIGKTRLALASAADLAGSFRDGARFVDLATVRDTALVVPAIAAAVDLADSTDEPLAEALTRALRPRDMLLVIDNAEHVLAAAPDLARLSAACPRLTLLVTSRRPLHVDGEHEFEVPALDEDAATALFVQRARSARADFEVTRANTAAVGEICRRLDGLPLAIELAAARIKVLSAEQIARRLEDRFNLLTRGADDAPERHRTLRATLDWSYQMLEAPRQSLLRALAIFAGGASLEAVEYVFSGAAPVLDSLEELVDHSLLVVHEEGGEARYRMLETVRQYALERLVEAGEDSTVGERHLDWCVTLVEQAEPDLFGAQQRTWLERLAREHDNVRAALGWAIEHNDAQRALRAAAPLWKFWEVRGHATEGQRWLEAGLALGTADQATSAKAQHGAASLAWLRGDYARATALHEANLVLREQIGDRHGLAVSLLYLADIMRSRGDAAQAIDRCSQSLAIFRALDDRRWCANALNSLSMALLDRGAVSAARAAIEEGLALFREIGGARRIAVALGNLGDIARAERDFDRADAVLVESLSTFVGLEDAWCSSVALESLALVAADRGEPRRAAMLFGAAEAQREVAAVPLPPADQPAHDRAVMLLRSKLGREGVSGAWSDGRALSLAAALDLAGTPAEDRDVAPLSLVPVDSPLTEREREVAHLIARGLTNRQIADSLVISKQTADKHVGNILGKLGAASRAQVAVWVVQSGLPASSAA